MKGKNVIEPGYEAGSEHCGECEKQTTEKESEVLFYDCLGFRAVLAFDEDKGENQRCQACLDSEIKELSPQLEYEKKRFDKHKQSPTYYGDHSSMQSGEG
jgi:hypothetical protein